LHTLSIPDPPPLLTITSFNGTARAARAFRRRRVSSMLFPPVAMHRVVGVVVVCVFRGDANRGAKRTGEHQLARHAI